MLQKMTKEECFSQMGMSYMPVATKAPSVSHENNNKDKEKAVPAPTTVGNGVPQINGNTAN